MLNNQGTSPSPSISSLPYISPIASKELTNIDKCEVILAGTKRAESEPNKNTSEENLCGNPEKSLIFLLNKK